MKLKIKLVLLSVMATLALPIIAADDKKLDDGIYAVIETTHGTITGKLFHKRAPLTVANFVGLIEGTIKHQRGDGKPFYDGLTFHRVVPNFVIQGGCPLGTGSGDPGYAFADEFHPELKHSKAGIFSMANSGPGTNGSQFFITTAPTPHLDNRHSVFGEVVQGMDSVNKVAIGDKIISIKVLREGADAKAYTVTQESFDKLRNTAAEANAKVLKAAAEEKAKLDAVKNKVVLETLAKKYPAAKTTETGLQYVITKEGTGEKPEKGNVVTAHLVGKLVNGQEILDTRKMKRPMSFPVGLGRVALKGWDEGLADMKKGETRILIVPPALGFGDRGFPQAGIPAGAFLVFDVELVEFTTQKAFEEKEAAAAKLAFEKTMVEVNKKYPTATKTASGLMSVVTKSGSGVTPKTGEKVSVHYVGTLLDGTEFDSSRKRNKAFEFSIGSGVIPGWSEGVALMQKGEIRTLIVPPALGYGPRGAGRVIPPNAFLIFEIELLEIK